MGAATKDAKPEAAKLVQYYVIRGQLESGKDADRQTFGPGDSIDLDEATGDELVARGVVSKVDPRRSAAETKRTDALEQRAAEAEARAEALADKLKAESERADKAEAELAKAKQPAPAPAPAAATGK